MPDFGLTEKGFKRKRYADVLESMEARARNLFGENINLTERSPLGLFIRVIAWSTGLLWQLAEAVYNSAFVDTATGNNLDKVALYIGLARRPAVRATGEVTFTGDDTTVIPAGLLVETRDGIRFQTIEEAVIDGATMVPVEAIEAGINGNVPAGTITEITNPTAGINTVTNAEATTGGLNQETDAELRARYALSVAKGGASTIDSIRASLLSTPGVRAALVIENNTASADGDGRPPKSFESYVLGGEPEDVAKTILQTKAAGIQAYGTESEIVTDDAGQEHTIGFTYAQEVDIEVNVEIVTNEVYHPDNDNLIKTAIIQYIGGQDEGGQVYAGLGMGDDVIYNRIIKLVMQIEGVENVDITINKVGESPGTSDIEIALTEVAETDWQKVTVSSA